MAAKGSPYFQRELKVTLEAEIIFTIRREIIRLQRQREGNRELLMAMKLGKAPEFSFWRQTSESTDTDHPNAFRMTNQEQCTRHIHQEQIQINKELAALNRQRKEHLDKLLKLKPETSTFPKGDLDFLLASDGED